MKVIDLLQRIANGEIEEDTMFEYSHGNGYKEYCTARQFFNRYIVDKENLNLEIWEDKVEDKKIEKIKNIKNINTDFYAKDCFYETLTKEEITLDIQTLKNKIKEIIDYINGGTND